MKRDTSALEEQLLSIASLRRLDGWTRPLAIGLLIGALSACTRPAPEVEKARADLEALSVLLQENHPMPIVEPARFQATFQQASVRADAQLKAAKTEREARRAVQHFVAAFEDPHLSVSDTGAGEWVWPGFVVSARGAEFVTMGTGVPEGTTLTACDGRSLTDWLHADLLPLQVGRRHGSWEDTRYAPRLTTGRAGDPLPTECSDTDGVSHTLNYQPVKRADLLLPWWKASFGNPRYGPQVTPIGSDVEGLWVELPTFDLEGASAAKMTAVLEQLSDARSAKVLVLDVRGNTGGSDIWGRRIVKQVWGVDRPMSAQTVSWRSSASNRTWIRNTLVPHARESSQEQAEALAGIAASMEAADSPALIVETLDATSGGPVKTPEAKVVLLTDSACSSACLLFVDRVLSMPGVLHVGEVTGADTPYTEVRWGELPSGAEWTMPIKVLGGRKRGAHEAYVPSIVYAGDRSEADVRAWVVKRLRESAKN